MPNLYPLVQTPTREYAQADGAGLPLVLVNATQSQTSPDQINTGWRGAKIVLTTTAIGTGSITLTIQGKDSVSGGYYTLLSGAAVVTNATNIYTIYPGLTALTNVSANDVLPAIWRVQVTANNANPATYTVGAVLIP